MKIFLYHENGWRMFQAEKLPVSTKEYKHHQDYLKAYRQYESEIAALKEKSIPVGNPEIFDLMEYGTRKREWIKGYHITGKIYEWPGDVEIKEELEYPIDHTSYPPYRDVAYLILKS